MATRTPEENEFFNEQRYFSQQAHFLEDVVDHMLFGGRDNEKLRDQIHATRRAIEQWVADGMPVSETKIELSYDQTVPMILAHNAEQDRIRHMAEPWESQAERDTKTRDLQIAEAIKLGAPGAQVRRFVYDEVSETNKNVKRIPRNKRGI